MYKRQIISRQEKNFSYKDISQNIKSELNKMGISEHELSSFKVNNMISNTLDQMVDRGNLSCFNNIYTPRKRQPKTKNIFTVMFNQT